MAGRGPGDSFMFRQGANRFQPFGMSHNSMMGNSMMSQHMMNSSLYENIHNLKTDMPSDVLELFKANEIGYVRPMHKSKCRSLDPVTSATFNIIELFPDFEEYYEAPVIETKSMKLQKKKQEKIEQAKEKLDENLQQWNPFEGAGLTTDPYKTLIVARLKYTTTERTIKMQFQKYGQVKYVKLITDKNGQSRGYAFVEYEKREDFINAYKNAHLRRIEGSRVIVDFEKGRTILLWRPRRLGGGQGNLRLTRQQVQARQRIKNHAQEMKEARRRERGEEDKKEKEHKQQKDHSRSRSRDRRDRRRERQREDRERDRERQHRERERNHERQRERERERERERHQTNKDLERQRHEKKGRNQMEVETRDRKQKKEKKERSRERSHRKEKKDKKEKKERKEYVAMNVPVDEFR